MTPSCPNPWLYVPKPLHVRSLRLICLPHAAGGATSYRPWIQNLPPDIELCAAQLPGHETRLKEPLQTDLARTVALFLDSIQQFLAEPYALFGHSMGALLVYEMVRQIQRRNLNLPVHLFVSGRKAPHLAKPEDELWRLPEPQFLDAVITRYNGIPKAVLNDMDLMRLILPVLRADVTMIDRYVCREEEPLNVPLSAMAGLDDPSVTFEELAGWRKFTRSAFRLEMLPGGHFYHQENRGPVIASLLRDLSPWRRLASRTS